MEAVKMSYNHRFPSSYSESLRVRPTNGHRKTLALAECSGEDAEVYGEITAGRGNMSGLTKSKCPECGVNGCLYWLGPPSGVVHWFCPDCGVEGMTSTYEEKKAAMGGNVAGGHGVETTNAMYDARREDSHEDYEVQAMAYSYEQWGDAGGEGAAEGYGPEAMVQSQEQVRTGVRADVGEPTKGFCPHCKGREAMYWVGSEGALHWFCPECESG